MTTLRITIDKFPHVHRKLRQNFMPAVRAGLTAGALSALPIVHAAVRAAPPANPSGTGQGGALNTGFYLRSWKADVHEKGAVLYSTASYAAVVELGRRPGKPMPPLQPLMHWAQRRLAVPEKDLRAVAFAIARKIASRGLLARHVMTGALPQIVDRVQQTLIAALDRVLALR